MSYKKVLVGSDGSDSSLNAVTHAADLAKASKAELVVVCAFQRPDQSLVEAIWEAGRIGREAVPTEIEWQLTPGGTAQRAIERAREAAVAAGVEPESRTVEGHPADVIIRTAEEEGADLIVLGNRGMTTASRFMLGSTPDKVSHHAPCDLMIVFTTGR